MFAGGVSTLNRDVREANFGKSLCDVFAKGEKLLNFETSTSTCS